MNTIPLIILFAAMLSSLYIHIRILARQTEIFSYNQEIHKDLKVIIKSLQRIELDILNGKHFVYKSYDDE